MKKTIIILTITLTFILLSCGKVKQKKLEGVWYNQEKNNYLVFQKNEFNTFIDYEYIYPFNGFKYRIKGDLIYIDVSIDKSKKPYYKYELQGDLLYLESLVGSENLKLLRIE